jgi:hypothetical protein
VVLMWPGAGRKRELWKLRRERKNTNWRARKARNSTEPRSNADTGGGPAAALSGDPGGVGGLTGDVSDSGGILRL